MSESRPLRAYANVQLGRQRSPEHEQGDHMVAYLRAANVKDGYLDLSDVKRMNFTPDEQKRFGLRDGDVLVTEGSGSLSAVGATAVWQGEIDGVVCFQNTLLRLRPRPGVDGRFLAWWCRYAFDDGLFASIASGANIYHLAAERLRSLPLSYVAPAQQRAIADFLDVEVARLDALVAKREKMVSLIDERRSSLIYHGVIGRLTERGPWRKASLAWAPRLPQHWGTVAVRQVARLGSGHTPSRNRPEYWKDCTIPWVTTGEVSQMRSDRLEFLENTREKISELGVANSSATVHPAGTVVLCRTAASAGYSAIMRHPMATSQDIVTWTCGPRLNPRYLLLCLRAMRRDLLERLAMGSTHRTIYMPDIEGIKIPLPPAAEQNRIVETVWERLRLAHETLDALDRQIALLRERRQALITAAVTGQFDVPEVAA